MLHVYLEVCGIRDKLKLQSSFQISWNSISLVYCLFFKNSISQVSGLLSLIFFNDCWNLYYWFKAEVVFFKLEGYVVIKVAFFLFFLLQLNCKSIFICVLVRYSSIWVISLLYIVIIDYIFFKCHRLPPCSMLLVINEKFKFFWGLFFRSYNAQIYIFRQKKNRNLLEWLIKGFWTWIAIGLLY